MHVTVCISTRDRGPSIAGTIRSLEASDYRDFDVVIVDQSRTNETEQAIRAIVRDDPQYTYIPSQTAGAATSRNIALAHARGSIVAWTDDDCEVSPQWLSRIAECFRNYPAVSQICGEVRAGAHDQALGLIPIYAVRRFRIISSPVRKWQEAGISASMAFRVEAVRA
jgi:glycosyltransferase involved in cell wall biosynthesis